MRRRNGGGRTGSGAHARRWRGSAAAVVALAVLLAAWPSAAQLVRGDANCDGMVNAADIGALTAAIFAGGSSCITADVNHDGRISAADMVAEIQVLAGLATPTSTPSNGPGATATASA